MWAETKENTLFKGLMVLFRAFHLYSVFQIISKPEVIEWLPGSYLCSFSDFSEWIYVYIIKTLMQVAVIRLDKSIDYMSGFKYCFLGQNALLPRQYLFCELEENYQPSHIARWWTQHKSLGRHEHAVWRAIKQTKQISLSKEWARKQDLSYQIH